jgi:molybdopterin molybdotransferase
MISVAEALEKVLQLAAVPQAEVVPLSQAAGRFMLTEARALRDQPPFSASAMDGYAICGPALPGTRFEVIGEASAGHRFDGHISAGQCTRIFTGAPVPQGAERVIIQEDALRDGQWITLRDKLDPAPYIRAQGQDFRVGDRVSPRWLRPSDIALLAAMNIPQVSVARRPIVAIIATGDELIAPGGIPREDQIIASNSYALKAMAESVGATARLLPIARDTEGDLRMVFDLAAGADLIVTIGGASVGDHDLVAKVAGDLGLERAFYKIAMRPGKPLMAGKLRGSSLIGLPGNPVSSIVCGHIFMLPLLRAMQGDLAPVAPLRRAVLTHDLPPNGPRAHYMRAEVAEGSGLPTIRAFEHQDSALLKTLTEANALLVRPVSDGPRLADSEVFFLPL